MSQAAAGDVDGRFSGGYAPQLVGVVTVDVADAPARVEYAVWSRFGRTPAATAFLDILDITAEDRQDS